MDSPRHVARYEVEKRLGQGGMGTVYLARDPQLGRRVAIKVIQADLDSAETRERFDREARAIAALNHPNIVAVYDSGEFEARPYLVLEYIEGRTLEAIIKSGEPVPLPVRLRWLDDLCEGLQVAHDKGIIHRDIKPANLIVDHLDRLRILDFGIARIAEDSRTHMSGMLGTVRYMAPEYIRGEQTDHRVDIFAAGAVAYELLTNRAAFPGETHATVLHNVISSDPAPLRDASDMNLDPRLEQVVLRALNKQPEQRFQSARELRDALRNVDEQAEPATPTVAVPRAVPAPVSPVRSVYWRRYAAIGAAAVVIAIAVIAFGGYFGTSPPANTSTGGPGRTPGPGGPPPAPPPSSTARLTARVVDSNGKDVVNAEVRLQPGNIPGVADGRGEYAFEGVPPGSYTVTVTHAGYRRDSRGMTLASGAAMRDTFTLVPEIAVDTRTNEGPGNDTKSADDKAKDDVRLRGLPKPEIEPPTAAGLFYVHDLKRQPGGSPPPAGGADANALARPGLHYSVLLSRAGQERKVDEATEFRSGDLVRFSFESNVDGYLYVGLEGSSGQWTVLFPHPDINGGRNDVKKFTEFRIPSGDDRFEFDATPGRERVFIYLSKVPMTLVPRLNRPVTKVELMARAEVEDLNATIRRRDLVLVQRASARQQSNAGQSDGYVVNSDESATAVSATLELIHK